MNKKRIVLFAHNAIAHPAMEWCRVLSLGGRIGWLARFGEWIHEATTPAADPMDTMTLGEFMDAARAIMERHGYGNMTCLVGAERWYHAESKIEKWRTRYSCSFWTASRTNHRTKDRPTPQLALQEMDLMLDLIALGQSTDTADMIVHEEPIVGNESEVFNG